MAHTPAHNRMQVLPDGSKMMSVTTPDGRHFTLLWDPAQGMSVFETPPATGGGQAGLGSLDPQGGSVLPPPVPSQDIGMASAAMPAQPPDMTGLWSGAYVATREPPVVRDAGVIPLGDGQPDRRSMSIGPGRGPTTVRLGGGQTFTAGGGPGQLFTGGGGPGRTTTRSAGIVDVQGPFYGPPRPPVTAGGRGFDVLYPQGGPGLQFDQTSPNVRVETPDPFTVYGPENLYRFEGDPIETNITYHPSPEHAQTMARSIFDQLMRSGRYGRR